MLKNTTMNKQTSRDAKPQQPGSICQPFPRRRGGVRSLSRVPPGDREGLFFFDPPLEYIRPPRDLRRPSLKRVDPCLLVLVPRAVCREPAEFQRVLLGVKYRPLCVRRCGRDLILRTAEAVGWRKVQPLNVQFLPFRHIFLPR